MQVENINISDIVPYKKNAKQHSSTQIKQIVESIKKFGFNDPIAVDENNVLIEGHGRMMAAEELQLKELPCIRLTHLNEQQKKAYILAHNKLTMNTGFDFDILSQELTDIIDFDMSDFGFDTDFSVLDDDGGSSDAGDYGGYYGDERERTYSAYNLDDFDIKKASGFYQIPTLEKCNIIPEDLISFNYVLSTNTRKAGVHFFIDDYQFERIWSKPYKYIDILGEFDCILTPDFSLYMDMPMAMKIWNVYRSRLVGQILQKAGLNVIPTLTWAERETYDFCFGGIEQGGTVAVSTVGVKKNNDALKVWHDGMTEAIKKIKPKSVLVYGGDIGYDFPKDMKLCYYENKAFRN